MACPSSTAALTHNGTIITLPHTSLPSPPPFLQTRLADDAPMILSKWRGSSQTALKLSSRGRESIIKEGRDGKATSTWRRASTGRGAHGPRETVPSQRLHTTEHTAQTSTPPSTERRLLLPRVALHANTIDGVRGIRQTRPVRVPPGASSEGAAPCSPDPRRADYRRNATAARVDTKRKIEIQETVLITTTCGIGIWLTRVDQGRHTRQPRAKRSSSKEGRYIRLSRTVPPVIRRTEMTEF